MGKYPFKKAKSIWLNGKLVKWEDARIHALSHVIHYGSGVFEGIRCYYDEDSGKPAIFRLKAHLDRFNDSAKVYRMDIPYSNKHLTEACRLVVKANGLRECYIRPLAYRAYVDDKDTWGHIGLNPLPCPVHVLIAAFEFPSYGAPMLRCVTSVWRRITPESLPPMAKACGLYLNSQLAFFNAISVQSIAEKAGLIPKDDKGLPKVSYEAVLLDHRGFVSEGPGENIFVVKDGELYTPPLHASILSGITRRSVITMARDLGYEVHECRDISPQELYTADEVFMTGTAAEIKSVVEIDFVPIGNGKQGPITERLKKKFFDITRGRDPNYKRWLTYVE